MNDQPDTNRDRLPVDPATGEPFQPRMQPGYYPGYDVLSQQNFWDATTREVVTARLAPEAPLRFFEPHEAEMMRAVCELVLPQTDRDPLYRIELVPKIDRRLAEKQTGGYRYADMPPDDEAYRRFLQALEQMARENHGRTFLELPWRDREALLKTVHEGKPKGATEVWKCLPVHRFWSLLVGDCIEAYYSHPWSWSEIGYGGPAYPRAYMRLERGQPEPWEADERRYDWEAPPGSVSDLSEESHHDQHPHLSRGGIHD